MSTVTASQDVMAGKTSSFSPAAQHPSRMATTRPVGAFTSSALTELNLK
jgi:hypothetical protein